MDEVIQLAVPATSANLGPGFDQLGLALDLHLRVRAIPAPLWSVVVRGEGAEILATDATNLIVQACLKGRALATAAGQHIRDQAYRLEVDNPIPVSRGLGSSATAIVAGLALAQLSKGGELERELLFQQAAAFEGHPDNVAPAVFGGLCICGPATAHGFSHRQGQLDPRIRFLAVIPGQSASTAKMRGILPDHYADAVLAHNAEACAQLLRGLAAGDAEGLRCSEADQMHQPYRLSAVPVTGQIYELLRAHDGIAGAFLSGSGATVAGWVMGPDPSVAIQALIQAHQIDARVVLLAPDLKGIVAQAQ